MNRKAVALSCILLSSALLTPAQAPTDKPATLPTFDYETARAHEIKPHRGTIPHQAGP